MKKVILGYGIQWMLLRQRFPGQIDEDAVANSHEILDAVQRGAVAFLRTPTDLRRRESDVPWYRRDFFWEGAAFGQAADHAFSRRRGNPDAKRSGDDYRAIHYTGYGLWAGIARVFHLPTISLHREYWTGVSDFDQYGPALAGGMAFGVTCGDLQFNERTIGRLNLPDYPGWIEGAAHGCGRALWFLFMHNSERLEAVVAAHPQHREELLEGLGIAVGFAQLRDGGGIWNSIQAFAPPQRESIARGVATAIAEVQDRAAVDRYLFPQLPPCIRDAVVTFRQISETLAQSPDQPYMSYFNAARRIRVLN